MEDVKTLSEITDKIYNFELSMTPFFKEMNEIADYYRLIPVGKRINGLTRTVVSEMTRAVETASTLWWKMMTAEVPNFELRPAHMGTNKDDIIAHTTLLTEQLRVKNFNRKSLETLRSLALFGSAFIEEPFIAKPNEPIKYTDYIPKSFFEVAYDRTAKDINNANWICSLHWISPTTLKMMADQEGMDQIFDKTEIDKAAASSQSITTIPPRVIQRLQSAGYIPSMYSNILELAIYQGILDANGDYKDMVVWVVNRRHIVRMHENPYPKRRKMIRYIGFIDFELENLSYGYGKLALKIQRDLNANRESMMDIIKMSLLPMFVVARSANVNPEDLNLIPWSLLEVDHPDSIAPLRPDLNAVGFGINLEKNLKEEFRSTTGVTDNLQAMVTQATAREVVLAQDSAIRKMSAYGEIISESLLGNHIRRCLDDNQAFIDAPLWMHWTDKRPLEILPENIQKPVQAFIRIITDKDFRPERLKQLLSFLQILTSMRNVVPNMNPEPIIEEVALMFQIDPERLKQPANIQLDPQRLQAMMGMLSSQRAGIIPGQNGGPAMATSPMGEQPQGVPMSQQ